MAVVENGFTENSDKFINSIGNYIKHNFSNLKLDPDDPEYRRQLMRPAEIKEDLNLMSERRRVSVVLKSESFRKELEEIIENYLRSQESTGLNSSLLSLQHIADLFSTIPGKRPLTGGGFTKSTSIFFITILPHFVQMICIPHLYLKAIKMELFLSTICEVPIQASTLDENACIAVNWPVFTG